MRVFLGSDHAGFELKQDLVVRLTAADHDVVDVGAFGYHPEDDYPAYCIDAATRVAAEPGCLGVVIGGSGNGEQIAANKVIGIRAALAWNEDTARLARQHNDANVLAIGARMHALEQAEAIISAFLRTPFSGAQRHRRRIEQVSQYEMTRILPSRS
jgi:ribose 5-phosphate isomerase B